MSSPTGRASIDLSSAPVPKPPTITAHAGQYSIEVSYLTNPGPFFNQHNPSFTNNNVEPDDKGLYNWVRSNELEAYAKALKLAPKYLATDGDLRASGCWHDGNTFRALRPIANRFDLDLSLGGNFDDPVTPAAAKAICDLAMDARHFGADVPQILPVTLDIEHTNTYQGGTVADRIRAYTDLFRLCRNCLGEDRSLFCYAFPGFNVGSVALPPDLAEADRAMMRMLTGINLGGYDWDLTIENTSTWFDGFDRLIGRVKNAHPEHDESLSVTLYPFQQVYYGAHPGEDGKPIPYGLWQEMVDAAVDEDVSIDLFCGGDGPNGEPVRVEPVMKHLEYLAKYRLNQ